MKLIRYRDGWWKEFIWFWVDEDDIKVSPEFDSKEEANQWYGQQIREWQANDD
jgi:hypothetical protein